jgi:hypothetical protein
MQYNTGKMKTVRLIDPRRERATSMMLNQMPAPATLGMPVEIKTAGDETLTVQVVIPTLYDGKKRCICPKEICLLVDDRQPVFLDREGVVQLMNKMEEFCSDTVLNL